MYVLNRIVSTLLAVALFAASLLAVAEIVLALLDRPYWLVPHPDWSAWLGEKTFASGVARAILIGLVLLGMGLLVLALRRGRPGSLALPARRDGVRVTASRRGIERTLSRAAQSADGVRDATVRAGKRKVRVTAHTVLREPGDLPRRVTAPVDERLEELGLAGTVRSQVTVSGKGNR